MSRMIGTVSRGVRAPIIRNGDDIVFIVKFKTCVLLRFKHGGGDNLDDVIAVSYNRCSDAAGYCTDNKTHNILTPLDWFIELAQKRA